MGDCGRCGADSYGARLCSTCEARKEADALRVRAEKAEAERDEWKRAAEANMGDERDGARAMVAQRWEALETRAAIAGEWDTKNNTARTRRAVNSGGAL